MPISTVSRQNNSCMANLTFVDCKSDVIHKTRNWEKGRDKPWEALKWGLNLKGECPNKNSECGGKTVWIPLGFSDTRGFSMSKECVVNRCTGCNEKIQNVVNVYLLRCSVELEGIDVNNIEVKDNKTVSEPYRALTFDEGNGANITQWKYLQIKVSPLPNAGESKGKSTNWFWSLLGY